MTLLSCEVFKCSDCDSADDLMSFWKIDDFRDQIEEKGEEPFEPLRSAGNIRARPTMIVASFSNTLWTHVSFNIDRKEHGESLTPRWPLQQDSMRYRSSEFVSSDDRSLKYWPRRFWYKVSTRRAPWSLLHTTHMMPTPKVIKMPIFLLVCIWRRHIPTSGTAKIEIDQHIQRWYSNISTRTSLIPSLNVTVEWADAVRFRA